MSTEIRQIEPTDLIRFSSCSEEEKAGRFWDGYTGHPCAEGRSGYVAVQDGRIIGAVGFVRSTYVVNGKKLTGLIPLSWEVEEESRGITGIRLLRRALSNADFFHGYGRLGGHESHLQRIEFQEDRRGEERPESDQAFCLPENTP